MNRDLFLNLLTLLSILLVVFWLVTDPRKKEERIQSYLKPKSIYIGFFTFLFFLLNYLSGKYFPLPDTGFDFILSMLGLVIFLLGIFVSIWAKVTMGKFWGVPAEHSKRQNKLLTQGPYMYSRNPIYLGLSLVLIGYSVAIQSCFSFLVLIPILYFSQFAKKEEELLEQIFKEEYRKYKRQVPRFF